MMISKVESEKISSDDLGSGRLLRDIEEISKALYLHNTLPKALISPEPKPKYVNEDLLQNDKKSSIWNWKPLKVLTHIRNHRLSCYFFLHVHSIEGLPLNFNDLSLSVHWKRKDEVLRTRSSRVSEGMAKFEETLMHRCSVYVSKSGPHDNVARYNPKLFLLYASVVGAPGVDIGKHWIDLTKLLPLTLEELEEQKKSSGKWMTSFKLWGKAKGAMVNVSFGFSLSGDNFLGSSSNFGKVPNLLKGNGTSGNDMLQRLGSVPSNSNRGAHIPSPSLDIKVHNEVSPYRGSITFLYQKLDEAKLNNSKEFNLSSSDLDPSVSQPESSTKSLVENSGYENNVSGFTVIDQGIEFPRKDELKIEDDAVRGFDDSAIETIDVADIFKGDEAVFDEEIECINNEVYGTVKVETVVADSSYRENVICNKEPFIEELESFFHNLSTSESPEMDFSFDESGFVELENYMPTKSRYKGGKIKDSLIFDDVTDSVANEFMNLLETEQNALGLGTDSEPDSPRERLLRQFETETLASGNFLFDLDAVAEQEGCPGDFDSSFLIQGAEMERDDVAPTLICKRKATLLENLETEALMREWGLNEWAFQNSPRTNSGAFGSPVYTSPEEPPELPPLGEGLGSILRTKGDGFLRSMTPSLFRNAKNGERLIMQVSNSVVLPAAMGSNSMDILQCWALVGAEKMFLQINKLMPLEEITGKTLRQVAWKAESKIEVLERGCLLLPDSEIDNNLYMRRNEVEEMPTGICCESDVEFLSLGDLPILAMDKIQSLSIEGLRIQSGLSNEEAPTSICVQSTGEISASSSKNSTDYIDELIGLSVSLDAWMKLDSGVIEDGCEINDQVSKILDDECEISDQVSKVLAAHCGNTETDPSRYEKCGYLGDKFTVALQLMLRDPFRDYESVGTSMLALIQVERLRGIHVEVRETNTENDKVSPRFKITDVHVAGLKAEPGKKQQSGSRWLHSSRMGKTKKQPFLKSNAIVRSSSQLIRKVKHEDTLWSISSYVHGGVAKWKELSALNLHIRNPDIFFK